MTGLSSAVRDRLANTGGEATTGRVAAALRAEERLLGDREVLALADELRAEFVGAGPLEPLLRSPDVTDVLVNGPDEVWIDTGSGLVRTAVRFPDEATLRRLAQRLTAAAGRRLDDASPYADARLPGGVRLHAVLPRWPRPAPACPCASPAAAPSRWTNWSRPAPSHPRAPTCWPL